MATADRVSMHEAAELLGVSHAKMWKLVKEGTLQAEINPLDRRQKLIRVGDLEGLIGTGASPEPPRPRTIGAFKIDIQSDEIDEWLEANWHPC